MAVLVVSDAPVCYRILVVDAVKTMVMLLGLSGHEARAAFGGQEALEMARTFPARCGVSRHRHARHERLRSGAALAGRSGDRVSQTDCIDRLGYKAGHPEIHNDGLSCPPHQTSRSGCGRGLAGKAVTGEASRLKAGHFNPAAALNFALRSEPALKNRKARYARGPTGLQQSAALLPCRFFPT